VDVDLDRVSTEPGKVERGIPGKVREFFKPENIIEM